MYTDPSSEFEKQTFNTNFHMSNFSIFPANYPQWIPYALIGSTGISLPLVLLVKEEYNRSAIDSGDATPDNESNPNAVH